MITQLKYVGIPTADQDRALKFYTEKLSFEVSTDQVAIDEDWSACDFVASNTSIIGLAHRGWARVGRLLTESHLQFCHSTPPSRGRRHPASRDPYLPFTTARFEAVPLTSVFAFCL